MVLLSLEAYSDLTDGVDAALETADRYAERNDKRYSHKEVFSTLRGMYSREQKIFVEWNKQFLLCEDLAAW